MILGVKGCLLGLFFDPAAVQKCFLAGVGAEIDILLNEKEYDSRSEKMKVKGKVISLSDGTLIATYGTNKNKSCTVGAAAALQVDGITIVLNSQRTQCKSTDHFSFMGLNVEKARSLIVKSTIHYRYAMFTLQLFIVDELILQYIMIKFDEIPFKMSFLMH